jgi:hypothetical protein
MFNVTRATTAAATNLSQQKRGHLFSKDGVKQYQQAEGQLSLRQGFESEIDVSQQAANAMGNFNVQQFRETINYASPEADAETALWVCPRSVATYSMRLSRLIQPQVIQSLLLLLLLLG